MLPLAPGFLSPRLAHEMGPALLLGYVEGDRAAPSARHIHDSPTLELADTPPHHLDLLGPAARPSPDSPPRRWRRWGCEQALIRPHVPSPSRPLSFKFDTTPLALSHSFFSTSLSPSRSLSLPLLSTSYPSPKNSPCLFHSLETLWCSGISIHNLISEDFAPVPATSLDSGPIWSQPILYTSCCYTHTLLFVPQPIAHQDALLCNTRSACRYGCGQGRPYFRRTSLSRRWPTYRGPI